MDDIVSIVRPSVVPQLFFKRLL